MLYRRGCKAVHRRTTLINFVPLPGPKGRAMAPPTFEFTTEDIEYLRHGDKGLKLRLYKPRGAGPFPAVVDLHGGAWGKGSLEEVKGRAEVLARSGLLVAALDFRDGSYGYPTAL